MNRPVIRSIGVLVAVDAVAGGAAGQVMCGDWELPPPINGIVEAFAEFQGEIYLAGSFSGAAGRYVTRWNGSSYVPLPQELVSAAGGVFSLAVFDDRGGEALYVGGNRFRLPNLPFPTNEQNGVVKWNGQSWSGTGFPSAVDVVALAVYDNGQGPELYAATPSSGAYLRRWNGALWSAVADAPRAHTLAVFDDGGGPALYVGGSFASVGGHAARNIAKYRQGTWSAVGGGLYWSTGLSSAVGCLKTLDLGQGERLFAGGLFNRAGELPVQFVASWDGTAWTAYPFRGYNLFQFVSPIFEDFAVLRNTDRPLLLAGASIFSTPPNGAISGGLLIWDGERWQCAGPPGTQGVRALLAREAFGSSTVLAGGYMHNGPSNIFFTQWTPGSLCWTNCDCSSGSPTLNVADFTCFLQRFAAGDMWANCDTSSVAPVLNVADFTCFLQRYAAGCP